MDLYQGSGGDILGHVSHGQIRVVSVGVTSIHDVTGIKTALNVSGSRLEH